MVEVGTCETSRITQGSGIKHLNQERSHGRS